MIHFFNPDLAGIVGTEKSVMLTNFYIWQNCGDLLEGNRFYDKKWWIFGSAKHLNVEIPYLSARSLARYLRQLEKGGYLISKQLDEGVMNKAKWYTLTDKAGKFFDKKQMLEKIKNLRNSYGENELPDNSFFGKFVKNVKKEIE